MLIATDEAERHDLSLTVGQFEIALLSAVAPFVKVPSLQYVDTEVLWAKSCVLDHLYKLQAVG